jgi:UDP-glucose 4-epimerase
MPLRPPRASPRLRGERILVTGGAGFIGSHLVDRLAGANEVLVVDDLSRGRARHLDRRAVLRVADVADRRALAAAIGDFAPGVVFHLAARHYVPECDADPPGTRRVNVGGTRALLEVLGSRGARPRAIVLASSAAVYAPSPGPHAERDRLGPIDVYGRTKKRAEDLVLRWAAATGTAVAVARLFNVYGPRETNPHVIPDVLAQLPAGTRPNGAPAPVRPSRIRLGNTASVRDYVHVRDVARVLEALAGRATVAGLIVNVGTGTGTSVTDLLATLSAIVGRPLAARTDPARLRRVDRERLVADTARLAHVLRLRARVTLAGGLAELVPVPARRRTD